VILFRVIAILRAMRYELDELRIPLVAGCLSFNLAPLPKAGGIFEGDFMRVRCAIAIA